MPKFNVPDEPSRFAVLLVAPAMPGGAAIAQTDLEGYAAVVGLAALSQLELPKDLGTRVIVVDTKARTSMRVVHAGMLDSTGQPTWDGHPVVNS